MALRFLDSFDHYTAAQVNRKWTATTGAVLDTGVHGNGMRGLLMKGLIVNPPTLIMEAYIKRIGDTSYETNYALFDTNQTEQIWLACHGDGSIQVSRYGSNPAVDNIAITAPDLVRSGVWYHLAWKVFVDPAAGTVEVRLNGATVVNLTGIKTMNDLGSGVGSFWTGALGSFTLGTSGGFTVFDDLVVMDGVDDGIHDPRLPGGGGFNQFLGPVTIRVKHPAAPGALAQWTPTPAVPNWQNVDDVTSDDDTSTNGADPTLTGSSDLFAMEPLAPGEDVVAVQSLILARTTASGTAAVAPVIKDGATTTPGSPVYQSSAYNYAIRPEPLLPDGSSWSAARWNAIQYGYKRTT